MVHIVSITSQGQISIPAQIRRDMKLVGKKQATVRREGDKIIVEPTKDIMDFEGALTHKALKGKTIDEIIEIEKKAWERGAVERYLKTLKK